ncbi:MAG TPA: transglycosylase domain-containing protein [Candidatus Acidoferrales bacterium]|nr:transglycosylase domain-containing protein [Candidatus Acidoferrales bacterium]
MSSGFDPPSRRRRARLQQARPGTPSVKTNGNGSPTPGGRLGGLNFRGFRPGGNGTARRNGTPARNGATNGHANGNGGPQQRRRRASLYRRNRMLPRKSRVMRVTVITLLVLLGLMATGAGVAFAGYNIFKSQLPDVAAVAADEPNLDSYVYDSSGSLIHVFHDSGIRHDHAALGAISRWVKLATIDVEDRHFYSEGSWDLPRLISVGVNDLTHGSTAGASTITEQLAKISFLGSTAPRSLDYKIKEIVLGNEIGSNFTKDQILEMYLNRIFYGNHAQGIQTAAELYFHTDASKLDLAQSSMLAGLPQSPSYYNPLDHDATTTVNPQAKARQHDVLRSMVANGDITDTQARAAFAEPLTFHSWQESEPVVAPDFLGYLEGWLTSHFGDAYLKPGGWRIYTTLDAAKQTLAEKTVQTQIDANGNRYNMHSAALVTMDPRTGAVLAMVGSGNPANHNLGDTNLATSLVTPGSTIKLWTYTAAIASGKFTMTTPILDAPTKFKQPNGVIYAPFDYDRRWHGTCLLKTCLGNSFNVPAVKVEVATGIPYITNLEIAAGLNSLSSPDNRPDASQYAATLGGLHHGVSVLELADGASMISNLGVHHDATPVSKIIDMGDGHAVFDYDPNATARRVVPENVAYIMNEITSNDTNRAAEFGAHGLLTLKDRRVSAKTGTGDNFVDNLTVGWTPDLLTAVWVGNPYPSCKGAPKGAACGTLNGVSSGITGAAPIWHDFMAAALAGTKATWYTRPADVVASGTTDNADFFLPTTQSQQLGGCYYWGPAPDPANPCQFTGDSPPPWYVPPSPTPTPGDGQGNGQGNGNGNGNGGHGIHPTPPPG